MAGENLFDQGGAGTRHAENEDRHGRGIAVAALFRDQGRGEGFLDRLEPRGHRRFVVIDPSALQRVGPEPMRERPLVVGDVGISLAEREMGVHAVVRRGRAVGRERLHCSKLRVAGSDPFDIGVVIEEFAVARLDCERLEIGFARRVQPPEVS